MCVFCSVYMSSMFKVDSFLRNANQILKYSAPDTIETRFSVRVFFIVKVKVEVYRWNGMKLKAS